MKYIVYLTTNTKNNKIYVGVHGTENPDKFDGYLGCGVNINYPKTIYNPKTPFQYAVKKYGFDSFRRSIIRIFDNQEDALDLEAFIVDEDFINRNDTYNITLGGGLPPLLNKVIYQYSLEGTFIKKWNSIHDAAKNLNITESSIGKAVLFKRTSCKFLWSDCKLDKLDISEYNIYNPEIPIYRYNSLGELEFTYKSMAECFKDLHCNLSNVQRAVKLGIMVKGCYLSDKFYSVYEKPKTERLCGMVHQYDLDGNYIQSFNSIKEGEGILKISLKGVNSAIKQHNSYYKGFLWCRGDKLNTMPPYKTPKSSARKIGQYTKDGDLIKKFNTLRECRKEFPNVSKVLNGSANHCHGFIFKYIED